MWRDKIYFSILTSSYITNSNDTILYDEHTIHECEITQSYSKSMVNVYFQSFPLYDYCVPMCFKLFNIVFFKCLGCRCIHLDITIPSM